MSDPKPIVTRPHALPFAAQRVIAYGDDSITYNPGGMMDVGFHATVPSPAQDIIYPAAPGNSNNGAEYLAAIKALRAIYRAGHRGPVTVHTDSQLVANQYSGAFGRNLERLRTATSYFAAVEIVWIRRRQHSRADALARRAYNEAITDGRQSA